jgi:hypothetical protein
MFEWVPPVVGCAVDPHWFSADPDPDLRPMRTRTWIQFRIQIQAFATKNFEILQLRRSYFIDQKLQQQQNFIPWSPGRTSMLHSALKKRTSNVQNMLHFFVIFRGIFAPAVVDQNKCGSGTTGWVP